MSKQSNVAIANALIKQYQAGLDQQSIADGLAAYLIEERRIGDKEAILRDVERQIFTKNSVLYVRTTSKYPLSDELKAKITKIFKSSSSADKVVIQENINKDVIGGVRCETADQQLYLTVRRQLQLLKGAITEAKAVN